MHPRAQLVGLRTFHRTLKAVGETAAGQPLFALGPVRLVLPDGSDHFYPVAACSRCSDTFQFPEPVRTESDLAMSSQPHLCPTCARMPADGASIARSRVSHALPPISAADSSAGAAGGLETGLGAAGGPSVGQGPSTDALDRLGEEAPEVLHSSTALGEKIEANAAPATAGLFDDAERGAALRRAAAAEAQEDADRDRDRAAALRAEREAAIARHHEELAGLRSRAEASASEVLRLALAEAARVREAVAEELAQADAVLSEANAQAAALRQAAEADAARARSAAAETMRAAEAELEAAIGLRVAEQLPPGQPAGP